MRICTHKHLSPILSVPVTMHNYTLMRLYMALYRYFLLRILLLCHPQRAYIRSIHRFQSCSHLRGQRRKIGIMWAWHLGRLFAKCRDFRRFAKISRYTVFTSVCSKDQLLKCGLWPHSVLICRPVSFAGNKWMARYGTPSNHVFSETLCTTSLTDYTAISQKLLTSNLALYFKVMTKLLSPTTSEQYIHHYSFLLTFLKVYFFSRSVSLYNNMLSLLHLLLMFLLLIKNSVDGLCNEQTTFGLIY